MEVDGAAFAAFEADELFVLTAPGGGALARGQSDDAFLTGQIFGQRIAHRSGGRLFARLIGGGNGGVVWRASRLLSNLFRAHAGFQLQQGKL